MRGTREELVSEERGSQGFTLKPSWHYQCVTIQNVKDRVESHRELPEGTVKSPQLIGRKLFCHSPPGSFSNMKKEMGGWGDCRRLANTAQSINQIFRVGEI